MEQTAVEWLEERFEKFLAYYEEHHKSEMYSIHQLSNDFEQAKQMEKEQIRDAFNQGMNNSVDYFIPFLNPNDESENYYNKTFKSE